MFSRRLLPSALPRLALARGRLAEPETGGRLGPYLVYTDVRDSGRLAFLDRVAGSLEAVYRARYGVTNPIVDGECGRER